MRQNYISDNIVVLSVGAKIPFNLRSVDTPTTVNELSSIVFGATSSGFQLTFDGDSDSIFSFDYAINSQNVGAAGNLGFAVVTYVGSSPLTNVSLDANPAALFNGLVVGDRLTIEGRCVVPKLSLAAGESQYIAFGFFDNTDSAVAAVTKCVQCRVHDKDVQVFDPLR